MKGIITKDLLGMKQVALTMGLLMLFYLALGFMNMKDGGGIVYFAVMAMIMNVMVPFSCAGYDEQCGWDQFGAALPVSKNKIVACRYIVGLIVIVFTTLVMLIANMLFAAFGGTPSGILAYALPIIVSMFYLVIMLPVIYKFGVQKSRFIMIAVMLLPSLLVAAFSMYMADRATEDDTAFLDTIDSLSSIPAVPAIIIATVIAAVFYVLSMLLSMRIYSRKEL